MTDKMRSSCCSFFDDHSWKSDFGNAPYFLFPIQNLSFYSRRSNFIHIALDFWWYHLEGIFPWKLKENYLYYHRSLAWMWTLLSFLCCSHDCISRFRCSALYTCLHCINPILIRCFLDSLEIQLKYYSYSI